MNCIVLIVLHTLHTHVYVYVRKDTQFSQNTSDACWPDVRHATVFVSVQRSWSKCCWLRRTKVRQTVPLKIPRAGREAPGFLALACLPGCRLGFFTQSRRMSPRFSDLTVVSSGRRRPKSATQILSQCGCDVAGQGAAFAVMLGSGGGKCGGGDTWFGGSVASGIMLA